MVGARSRSLDSRGTRQATAAGAGAVQRLWLSWTVAGSSARAHPRTRRVDGVAYDRRRLTASSSAASGRWKNRNRASGSSPTRSRAASTPSLIAGKPGVAFPASSFRRNRGLAATCCPPSVSKDPLASQPSRPKGVPSDSGRSCLYPQTLPRANDRRQSLQDLLCPSFGDGVPLQCACKGAFRWRL